MAEDPRAVQLHPVVIKGKITEGLEWSLHGYKGAASCLSLSHYPPARGLPNNL